MVAKYRLIKDNGHAAQRDSVRDVLLQSPSMMFRSWILRSVMWSANRALCPILGSAMACLNLYIGRSGSY